MGYVNISQVARGEPFDNSTNGFISQNSQEAIEEAKATAEGKARYAISSGYNGTANVGRWFEFTANNPSNLTPFILARDSKLEEISLSNNSTTTSTVGIYKNISTTPVLIASISLSNQIYNFVNNYSITLYSGEQLGVKVDAGTLSRPMCTLFFEII